MAERRTVIPQKLIHTITEQKDEQGKFIPYSIRVLTRDGEEIDIDRVVHIPIKKGDEKAIRNQRRGMIRFKILSSGEIRYVYKGLIIEINGKRVVNYINKEVIHE